MHNQNWLYNVCWSTFVTTISVKDFTMFYCMYINLWLILWYSKSKGFNVYRITPRKFADWWTKKEWWDKKHKLHRWIEVLQIRSLTIQCWRHSSPSAVPSWFSSWEMGRQQLLYIAINMKLLTAEYFRSVDVVKLMLYSPCEIVNVGLHPTLSQFSKLRVV